MELYIKQKIFTFGDKYTIYDINESVIYTVEGELFSFGAKMRLLNTNGEELFFIKQRITFFLSEYEIYKGNAFFAKLNQKFSFLTPSLSIDSALGTFDVVGNFMGMDFEILLNNQPFGYIKKEWLTWGDTYKLTIPNDTDAAFFVALVVAIDNCIHSNRGSSSST